MSELGPLDNDGDGEDAWLGARFSGLVVSVSGFPGEIADLTSSKYPPTTPDNAKPSSENEKYVYMLEEIGERIGMHHQSHLQTLVSFLYILMKTKLKFGKCTTVLEEFYNGSVHTKQLFRSAMKSRKNRLFDCSDLKEALINTANMIKQLQDEDNNNGKVHGSLARAGKVKSQTAKVEKQETRNKRPEEVRSIAEDLLTLLLPVAREDEPCSNK
ncbi:7620_t:CDS:2 [Paraglomus brasilianum]|uniref:7620_t:CDS:1 n=1 Tax=Paraglomus brasilianum TaxID=144538 RepID=A0A9N9GGG7_9GLOM|nr:7620_t:CDS:2 [Paraglomus brasilianum]